LINLSRIAKISKEKNSHIYKDTIKYSISNKNIIKELKNKNTSNLNDNIYL